MKRYSWRGKTTDKKVYIMKAVKRKKKEKKSQNKNQLAGIERSRALSAREQRELGGGGGGSKVWGWRWVRDGKFVNELWHTLRV